MDKRSHETTTTSTEDGELWKKLVSAQRWSDRLAACLLTANSDGCLEWMETAQELLNRYFDDVGEGQTVIMQHHQTGESYLDLVGKDGAK